MTELEISTRSTVSQCYSQDVTSPHHVPCLHDRPQSANKPPTKAKKLRALPKPGQLEDKPGEKGKRLILRHVMSSVEGIKS